tara:strand:- start:59 stop:481 length:423 start_codon:yes stop_codon:yes gene_type:complete
MIYFKDILKLIDHITEGDVLTKKEIKKYDYNKNKVVDEKDFITALKKWMTGPFIERTGIHRYFLKKHLKNQLKKVINRTDKDNIIYNGNITQSQVEYIGDKIKQLGEKYLSSETEYPDLTYKPKLISKLESKLNELGYFF